MLKFYSFALFILLAFPTFAGEIKRFTASEAREVAQSFEKQINDERRERLDNSINEVYNQIQEAAQRGEYVIRYDTSSFNTVEQAVIKAEFESSGFLVKESKFYSSRRNNYGTSFYTGPGFDISWINKLE